LNFRFQLRIISIINSGTASKIDLSSVKSLQDSLKIIAFIELCLGYSPVYYIIKDIVCEILMSKLLALVGHLFPCGLILLKLLT